MGGMRSIVSGADEAVLSDPGPVEHGGTHADQRPLPHGTAVKDGPMADGDMGADVHIIARIHMDHTVVLNIAALTHADGGGLRPEHRMEPEAAPGGNGHVAADHCVGCQHGLRRDHRLFHIYDHSFPLRSKAPKEYETRYL